MSLCFSQLSSLFFSCTGSNDIPVFVEATKQWERVCRVTYA